MTKPITTTTYWDYIRVKEILSLQGGLGDDDTALEQDEVVFITVHQVYELWFKLALRDLEAARDLFKKDRVPDDHLAGVYRRLERMRIIFGLAVDHFPLIETLTTRDYLEFRDKLFPANGGQSAQFREVEILFGLDAENARIPYVTGGRFEDVLASPDGSTSWSLARVKRRMEDRPSFKEAVDSWLYRTPIHASTPDDANDAATVDRFIDTYLRTHRNALQTLAEELCRSAKSPAERDTLRERYANEARQAEIFLNAEDVDSAERARRRRIRAGVLFIETYRELPLLAWPRQILDAIIAVEQAFIYYRQRHARMAERMIGRRVGTGGSSGVDYLDQTALAYRIFKDLWAVRTVLVRRDALPDPEKPEFYQFRFDASPGGRP